jgi:hypothetical protein
MEIVVAAGGVDEKPVDIGGAVAIDCGTGGPCTDAKATGEAVGVRVMGV